LNFIICWDLNH